MFKIILVLCAVLAVAKGLDKNDIDDYLEKHSVEEQKKYLADYVTNHMNEIMENVNNTLLNLQAVYSHKTNLEEQRSNVTGYLEAYSKSLDLLTDSKQCVDKYRTEIPIINNIDISMSKCVEQYLDTIPPQPRNLFNKMLLPFYNSFLIEMQDCLGFKNTPKNYLSCFYPALNAMEKFLEIFSKKFTALVNKVISEQNENAINEASYCVTSIERQTYNKIAQVKVLIDNCMKSKDENHVKHLV